MATFRLEAKIIGRSQGRSATASAAYRSGERVKDDRTGEVFDYSRMRGVVHSEIIAPKNTPVWMRDRAQLWNAVEKVEKRKDAQIARDLVLSLPHELTHTQRVELVRDFAKSEFVSRGMIADINIHAPDRKGDQRNHHAHVMLTMRTLTGDGFGKKFREWNGTEQLKEWRAQWAKTVNRHLERAGLEARVDHRSNEDQGLDREPEPKQGPIATEMERAGRPSHAGDDRRAAQARNEERAVIAAELAAVSAEIIDLDEERRKRQAQELASPTAPIIATDDPGMVAQQREARALAERLAARAARTQPYATREAPAPQQTARPQPNAAAELLAALKARLQPEPTREAQPAPQPKPQPIQKAPSPTPPVVTPPPVLSRSPMPAPQPTQKPSTPAPVQHTISQPVARPQPVTPAPISQPKPQPPEQKATPQPSIQQPIVRQSFSTPPATTPRPVEQKAQTPPVIWRQVTTQPPPPVPAFSRQPTPPAQPKPQPAPQPAQEKARATPSVPPPTPEKEKALEIDERTRRFMEQLERNFTRDDKGGRSR